MSQEHGIDISDSLGSASASKSDSTNDPNTMKQEYKHNSPSTCHQKNRPCGDLLQGSRDEYINICLPLYEASLTGDWQAAKIILDKRPELVRFAVHLNYDTALHIAASAEVNQQTEDFVKNLVDMMENEDLELENGDNMNAFMVVATHGSPKMAKIMLNKHKTLPTLRGFNTNVLYGSLQASVFFGNLEMARFLYGLSKELNIQHMSEDVQTKILSYSIKGNMFDITLNILMDYPESLINSRNVASILDDLARKPEALNRTEPNIIWKITDSIFAKLHLKKRLLEDDHHALNILKKVINIILRSNDIDILKILKGPCNNDGDQYMHAFGILFAAAELGNTRFLIEILRAFPHLLLVENNDGHTIFHIAIMHRHEGIYNLLHELGTRRFSVTTHRDKRDNSILHLVGITSKKIQLQPVSGASLLMQRELLWFQDVSKMVPPFTREEKNKDGKTPYQLFFENNKDLVSSGLKWMKDCMVAATLIVTVAFAVAFTVPGGYNQDNGFPVFIHEPTFLVFVIADAISLFSSSTSLLVFLSILTSRYGQRDFLYSLPRKLMIGLVSLFISVAAMMVTFAASFFVLYRNGLRWVPIIISIFAATPVIVFALLQFPLWLDMFRSMYDSRYIFNPRRRIFFYKNK